MEGGDGYVWTCYKRSSNELSCTGTDDYPSQLTFRGESVFLLVEGSKPEQGQIIEQTENENVKLRFGSGVWVRQGTT